MILQSVPFGVLVSVQALQTGVHENFILRDPAICDYLDRLLAMVALK
jgi:hypothetical protein